MKTIIPTRAAALLSLFALTIAGCGGGGSPYSPKNDTGGGATPTPPVTTPGGPGFSDPDFSLTLSPAAVELPGSGTAKFSVLVRADSTFKGQVKLSALADTYSGKPYGGGPVTFTPATVTPTQAGVTVSGSVTRSGDPNQNTQMIVKGEGDGIVRTKPLSILSNGFFLSLEAKSGESDADLVRRFTLTISNDAGSGPIALRLAPELASAGLAGKGLPASVRVVGLPSSVTFAAGETEKKVDLTLTFPQDVSPDFYQLVVQAKRGAASNVATGQLKFAPLFVSVAISNGNPKTKGLTYTQDIVVRRRYGFTGTATVTQVRIGSPQDLPAGTVVTGLPATASFATPGGERVLPIKVQFPAGTKPGPYILSFHVKSSAGDVDSNYTVVITVGGP